MSLIGSIWEDKSEDKNYLIVNAYEIEDNFFIDFFCSTDYKVRLKIGGYRAKRKILSEEDCAKWLNEYWKRII